MSGGEVLVFGALLSFDAAFESWRSLA